MVEFPSKVDRGQSSEDGFEESARLDHEVQLRLILVYRFELMIESNRGPDAASPNPLPGLTGAELDHGHPGLETIRHLEHALRRFGHCARWIAFHALYVPSPCLGPLLGLGEVVPRHL